MVYMVYIGIDPGLDGALAVSDSPGNLRVLDTPTLIVAGKKNRRDYDIPMMCDYLTKAMVSPPAYCRVGIESVHSMPDQGVASSFNFGKGFGIWLGLVVALKMPYDLIIPQRWKKVMLDGMGKEKDASRLRAQQLFPTSELSLKKHHGRADALLIMEFLRRQCSQ